AVDEDARGIGGVREQQAVAFAGLKHVELHQPRSFRSFTRCTSSRHAIGLMTPNPASLAQAKLAPGSGVAVRLRIASICAAVRRGSMFSIRPMTPVTKGLAMLVPLSDSH